MMGLIVKGNVASTFKKNYSSFAHLQFNDTFANSFVFRNQKIILFHIFIEFTPTVFVIIKIVNAYL